MFKRIQHLAVLLAIFSLFTGLVGTSPAGATSGLAGADQSLFAEPEIDITVTQIASGLYHTCALLSTGGVKCWGANDRGQLGNGTTVEHFTPRYVSGLLSGVTQISAGAAHTCALLSTDGVKCWGANKFGAVGDSTSTDRLIPVDVSDLNNGVMQISAGAAHTCALLSTGGVKCWGFNHYGQLGDDSTTNRFTSVDVVGLSNGVKSISSGKEHTCALLSNAGEVKCWGNGEFGRLGDGIHGESHTPVDVSGLSGVVQISAGAEHSCALLSAGNVKCWGNGYYGQLGTGTIMPQFTPVDVSDLSSNVIQISAAAAHTCALLSTGGVKCWGAEGMVGDGTNFPDRLTPVDVNGLSSGVNIISQGLGVSCAGLPHGEMKCWGYNAFGQLGDGTIDHHFEPVRTELFVNSFKGSAEIVSDQPVVAIGRPHIGKEIMAYGGVNTGAITVYLPMLFNNTWGSYTSSFTVENVSKSTVTFDLEFKDALKGATNCLIEGQSLPQHGVKTYDVTSLPACTTGELPSGWYGGATISSDQPITAIARPNINGTDAVTYNGVTGGADTAYLPMLFRGIWGYESAFYVQNLHASEDATVTISFYDNQGNFTCSFTDPFSIGPSVTRGYWMANINDTTCSGGTGGSGGDDIGTGFPFSGWAGSAVITSSGSDNIVAIGRPHLGAEVAAYNGFTAGGTTNYLPMLFRGMWGYNAAIYVQNIAPDPTSIVITFYDTAGSEVCIYTDPAPLGQNATRGYWLPFINCNDGRSFPAGGWAGSAKIETTQNVIAVGRPHLSDGQVVVYNAFTGGGTNVYVPMLFRDYGGSESALYIQNLSSTDAANMTITFYDEEREFYCAMEKVVQPGASGAIWFASLEYSVCPP